MNGCPVCDWDGMVTITHTRTVTSYTHIIDMDGEIFRGNTCTEPIQDNKSILPSIL